MIVYLDTSAIVPIFVSEPSSQVCRRIWADAERRVSSRLTFVETAAAFAMAERRGRLSARQHDAAWANFEDSWPDVDVLDMTAELATAAATLSRMLALRGYDAVHCASAAEISEPDVVAVAGDSRLLSAWGSLGVTVLDVNQA